jgi:hypothetical protein
LGDLIIGESAITINNIMESQPREIQRYVTPDGKIPFDQWYESLSDAKTQYKIDARIERIALGNLGDYRFLGAGVYEFRINYGPGYRLYFGQIGLKIVLLLFGGDKSTQKQDIRQAQEYWKDYDKH